MMTSNDTNRVAALDILRGCAVMGILWMNITAFALPSAANFNPAAAGPLSRWDIAAWFVGFVAVDGKMRGLFSLLFGASMLVLMDKAEMAGDDGRKVQIKRAAWLLVFGLAHYLLLWRGDILMTYALVGLIAMLFTGMEAMRLVNWAFAAFLVHFLLVTTFVADLYVWQHQAMMADAPAALVAGYRDFVASMSDPASAAIRGETALYRSGFAAIFAHHVGLYLGEWPRSFLFSAFDTLGFMLLGMAMLKGGFITGQWDASQYRQTARHCFLIGLPPMIALAVWAITSGFAPVAMSGIVMAWSFPFRIPLTVGWVALILWLAVRHRGHPLLLRIGAAGRLAFSNYLGTSLVMTAIFYGWGLGRFGQIGPAGLIPFVLGGWAVMLMWSLFWTNRFTTGPVEYLWRTLASGRLQSFRKSI